MIKPDKFIIFGTLKEDEADPFLAKKSCFFQERGVY